MFLQRLRRQYNSYFTHTWEFAKNGRKMAIDIKKKWCKKDMPIRTELAVSVGSGLVKSTVAERGHRVKLCYIPQTAMEVELYTTRNWKWRQPSNETISRSHTPCALASAIRANAMPYTQRFARTQAVFKKRPRVYKRLQYAEPHLLRALGSRAGATKGNCNGSQKVEIRNCNGSSKKPAFVVEKPGGKT